MKIPKDLMFEYLLSLENYSDSHPSLKDITMKEALDAQKKIIDLGFSAVSYTHLTLPTKA